ncbi:MAG TPA: histidine phosphatase family protein [Candidatus Diapherotrites archaeon]|uniref:Histidine phosphatase family protein n=1 Tax=Candidatus Iainarchaeum sp. TaxID=3101447 RepID=A0A7J4IYA1_9ARCH|nr:histidine phosphatase family protein [Candidatus Diapherotrites archaeon]
MRLVLCRHGETDYNVQRRLQGVMNTLINKRGISQAGLISQKLKDEKFDFIFSSPLKRCVQTAKIIAKPHGGKIIYRDGLAEVNLGKYTGMDRHEIEVNFPGDWSRRVDSKYSFLHEAGESYREVDEKRVKPLLSEFREKYSSRSILVITHAGICRLLLGSMLGLHPQEKMEIEFPNDCIYYIDYLPHKTFVKYYLAESKKDGTGYLHRLDDGKKMEFMKFKEQA